MQIEISPLVYFGLGAVIQKGVEFMFKRIEKGSSTTVMIAERIGKLDSSDQRQWEKIDEMKDNKARIQEVELQTEFLLSKITMLRNAVEIQSDTKLPDEKWAFVRHERKEPLI